MTDIAIGLLRNQINSEANFIWDNCRTLGFETKSYSTLPLDATKFIAQLVPALRAKRTRISKLSPASNDSPKAMAKVAKLIEPSKTGRNLNDNTTTVQSFDISSNMYVSKRV